MSLESALQEAKEELVAARKALYAAEVKAHALEQEVKAQAENARHLVVHAFAREEVELANDPTKTSGQPYVAPVIAAQEPPAEDADSALGSSAEGTAGAPSGAPSSEAEAQSSPDEQSVAPESVPPSEVPDGAEAGGGAEQPVLPQGESSSVEEVIAPGDEQTASSAPSEEGQVASGDQTDPSVDTSSEQAVSESGLAASQTVENDGSENSESSEAVATDPPIEGDQVVSDAQTEQPAEGGESAAPEEA